MTWSSLRPWRGAALAAAALATGALSACQPFPAVHPDNRVAPVGGQRNGELAADRLAPAGAGCQVYLAAAPSLVALLAAARHDGVALEARECYRDLSGQRWWRSWWCGQGRCANAAVPGTSPHGWGKAVDLSEPGGMADGSVGSRWLVAHAAFYGWNHPGWARPGGAAPEPWHWEWVGDGGTMMAGSAEVA